MKYITNPRDIALIAESLLIIVYLICLLAREVRDFIRRQRGRRAKELELAQRPARMAERRKWDHERFDEMAREIGYSIEEVVPPKRVPKS